MNQKKIIILLNQGKKGRKLKNMLTFLINGYQWLTNHYYALGKY